ncbi:MAG TPA: hypothetical protein VKY36_00790 [Moheibacter sp.]|nr:hypothetical protein [Moheibacter sp.]
MDEVKIYYKPEVEDFINELVYQLYINEYFGFLESAINYKDKIIDFIEENISTFPHRPTPFALRKLGSRYLFYKSNERTTWYIFFEKSENTYLITYITNNHSPFAGFF